MCCNLSHDFEQVMRDRKKKSAFVACKSAFSPLVFFPGAHMNFTSGQCSVKARASRYSDGVIHPLMQLLMNNYRDFSGKAGLKES